MAERRAKMPAEYLPVFCREMYQMSHSGISPADGLPLLKEDEADKDVLRWLSSMCKDTENGDPLAEAMGKTEAFPKYMINMVNIAEETGNLESTFLALQKYYDRQNRLRSDIQTALTIPILLMVVMVAVVILLITQVLPVFDRVFAQLGVRMGTLAVSMMNAGSVLARAGAVLAIILGVIVAAAVVVAAVPSLRSGFSKWFTRSFGDRGILGQMAVARFSAAMAMASAGGMEMGEAVELAANLSGGATAFDQKTKDCLKAIEEGESVSDAMSKSGIFAGRDCLILKLAEQTGTLSETLDDLARHQEEESLRRIDHLVGTIEPAIVVLTSSLAGVILLSVMLPLMGLLSTIG